MKELPKTDADAHDFIQFRGKQTSVTHDQTGVRFVADHRDGHIGHQPLPVVDPDDPDAPGDAVAQPVAELLVEQNPLVCWGVVCEHPTPDGDGDVCGDVFDSPKARNSHQSAHADGSGGGDA